MNQGYLEQQSKQFNQATRKRLIGALIAYICIIAVLYVLLKDSFDFNDPSSRQVFGYAAVFYSDYDDCNRSRVIQIKPNSREWQEFNSSV